MRVDQLLWVGLAAVSAGSVLLGRPWTAIPGRRATSPEVWATPLFHETNLVLAVLWTVLLALVAWASMRVSPWWSVLFGKGFAVLGLLSGWIAGAYVRFRIGFF